MINNDTVINNLLHDLLGICTLMIQHQVATPMGKVNVFYDKAKRMMSEVFVVENCKSILMRKKVKSV